MTHSTESIKDLKPIIFWDADIEIAQVISATKKSWLSLRSLSDIGEDHLGFSSLAEDQNGNLYWRKRQRHGADIFIHFIPKSK